MASAEQLKWRNELAEETAKAKNAINQRFGSGSKADELVRQSLIGQVDRYVCNAQYALRDGIIPRHLIGVIKRHTEAFEPDEMCDRADAIREATNGRR